MSITETDMTYEEMQKIASDGHICGECGGRLNLAWGGTGYILRCRDISHHTMTRHRKESDYEKQINESFRRVNKMDTNALMAMDEAHMLQRIEKAKFPSQLTIQDKRLLAQVAITYGFDPLMGEITIYQGNPYISIDGRRRKSQETGELDGIQSRPATKKERQDWDIPDGDYFFHVDVFRKGCEHSFEGWGRVTQREIERAKTQAEGHNRDPYFLPLVKDPQGMAEKRAEAKGLRRGFHIPLPSIEDIGSPEEDNHVKVDITTGEIINGEVQKAPDASQDKQETPQEKKAVEVVKERGIMANWDVFLASVKKVKWETGIRDFIYQQFDVADVGDLKTLIGKLNSEEQERLAAEVKERLVMR